MMAPKLHECRLRIVKFDLGLILNLTLLQGAPLRLELLDEVQPPCPLCLVQVDSRVAIAKKLNEILHAGTRMVGQTLDYLVCSRL